MRDLDKSEKPYRPCPILPELFAYMRDSYEVEHGMRKRIPMFAHLWEAVKVWELQTDKRGRFADKRLRESRFRAGQEMSIIWEAVARMQKYRVIPDARDAKEMLVYVQALSLIHI